MLWQAQEAEQDWNSNGKIYENVIEVEQVKGNRWWIGVSCLILLIHDSFGSFLFGINIVSCYFNIFAIVDNG